MKKAFTLVELLIVITLISILSVAVLATINPIEQTNKARDAQFKNDAAEILSAYERFFASQNKYPWNVNLTGTSYPEGTPVGLNATEPAFGVVGSAVGATDSPLFLTSELKSSFMGKAPFGATVTQMDNMWTFSNGSDSNYVCYVPKAKVNRFATPNKLKCLTIGAAPALESIGTGGCTAMVEADWAAATAAAPSATLANMMCVPE